MTKEEKNNKTDSKSSRIVKGIFKGIAWFLGGIILLLVVVLLAIQTPFVKKKIVSIAENQVNNILNAELSVGKLTGNFFTNLGLENVMLRSTDQDTLAFIPQLHLNYQLLPLLNNRIVVEKIILDNPYIHLAQLPDSTWNVMHIAKPSEEPSDTTSSFNMDILLNKLLLNDGYVRIDAFNTQIPREIRDFFIDVSGYYSTAEQKVALDDLRLKAFNPDVELVALSINGKADKNLIEVEKLLLQTIDNRIEANAEYYLTEDGKSQVVLNTSPIILEEFKAFLPDSFHIGAKPRLDIKAELQNKNLDLNASLRDSLQGIHIQAQAYQLIEYLMDSLVNPVTYKLDLGVDKVDLRYWLDNPEMNYLINGKLNAEGEGLDPHTLRAKVDGNFGNIMLQNNPVAELTLTLNYLAGNIDGIVSGSGNFGSLRLVPRVQKILSDNPLYTVNLTTRRLDVSPFLGNRQYKTDLNLNADVKGSGFDLDKINAQTKIIMTPSSAMGIRIDTLNSQIDLVRQNLIVHELFLETLSAQLLAQGNYNMKGRSDLTLQAQVDDASEIARFAGVDSLQTSLMLDAHLTGQPDSLKADLLLGVGHTLYNQMSLDTLSVTGQGTLYKKNIEATADLKASQFSTGSIDVDSIDLHVVTDTKNFDLGLSAGGKDFKTQLNGLVQMGDAIQVALSDFLFDYKGYNWRQTSDTAFVHVGSTQYEVRNLWIASGDLSLGQAVYIDGIVDREGEQDMQVSVNNLDIGDMMKVFKPDMKIEGIANLDMWLQGQAFSPTLAGSLRVDSTMLENYYFDTIFSDINLREKEFAIDLDITPRENGRITGEGRAPVDVRLDSMTFGVVPDKADSIYARLLIDRFPLSILKVFVPADDVQGVINSYVNVDGTMGAPDITGNLKINNGKVLMKQYGVDYKTIQTNIEIARDEVKVDTFLIRSNDGTMRMEGGVKFNSEIYNADINNSQLKVTFNRFNPLDHKQLNMELSGNVDLRSTVDSVLFSGDISIPEANVNLPFLMNLLGQFSTPNLPQPLLIVEMEKYNMMGDSVVYTVRPDTTQTDSVKVNRFAFLDNLQGKIKVEIPRNTWIRNDDMRLELSGDLELLKHRDFFEIFGTIDVIRGQYNLLGKVFVIESGTVTFQGGEKLNPILNVVATYTFRDPDRNKKDMNVAVTGDLDNMKIQFTLEGQQISEGDALSYILFGMNMDALTSGQQSSLNSSIDALGIAEMAAASLISSQLTKLLGNVLSVDYIEFKAGSSFDNASFTVGKYLTNRLFASYEQHIGVLEDNDVARYEVTLEYELFRFLFIQLASSPLSNGFDLIFKINSDTKFTR